MLLFVVLTGCADPWFVSEPAIPASSFATAESGTTDAIAVGTTYALSTSLQGYADPVLVDVEPADVVEVVSQTREGNWLELELRAVEPADAVVTVHTGERVLKSWDVPFRTPDRLEFRHMVDVVRNVDEPAVGPVVSVRGGRVGAEMVAWAGESHVLNLPLEDGDDGGLEASWERIDGRSFVQVDVGGEGVVLGTPLYPELGGWEVSTVRDRDVARIELLQPLGEPTEEFAVVAVGFTEEGVRVQGLPARWRSDGERLRDRTDAFLVDPELPGEREVTVRFRGEERGFVSPAGGQPVWSSSTCSSAGGAVGWAGVFLALLGLRRRRH